MQSRSWDIVQSSRNTLCGCYLYRSTASDPSGLAKQFLVLERAVIRSSAHDALLQVQTHWGPCPMAKSICVVSLFGRQPTEVM